MRPGWEARVYAGNAAAAVNMDACGTFRFVTALPTMSVAT
jgi:hypothetical protein